MISTDWDLSDLIIFILDPSEYCGYTIEDQNKLLVDIHQLFSDVKIIDIENKVDITKTNSDRLKISAMDGQGLDELMEVIEDSIKDFIDDPAEDSF